MKRIVTVLSLALALMLSLSACSMVKLNEERDGKTVVAVVGNTKILKSDYKLMLERTLNNYGLDPRSSSTDTASYVEYYSTNTLDALVNQELMMQKAQEMGILPLTDEDEKDFEESYKATLESLYDAARASIVPEEGAEDVEEDTEKMVQAMIDEYFASMLFDEPSYKEYTKTFYIMDKVEAECTKDITVSEDSIREKYEDSVEDQKETFTDSPMSYESSYVYGRDIYYTPAGVRVVRQILFPIPDEDYDEISQLREDGNDEEADAIRDAALEALRPQAEAALAELQASPDQFDEIAAKYEDDATLGTSEIMMAVAPDGTTYDKTFSDAALAMKAVGDVSQELVATDTGYSILICDEIPASGATPMTEYYDSIHDSLLEELRSKELASLLITWTDEIGVEKYPDRCKIDWTNK